MEFQKSICYLILALPLYVKNVVGYSPVRGRMYLQVSFLSQGSNQFWIEYKMIIASDRK